MLMQQFIITAEQIETVNRWLRTVDAARHRIEAIGSVENREISGELEESAQAIADVLANLQRSQVH
ncbi:MAG: hypothetical protein DMF91_03265 [Acidobacteria bacterium]|nr:MAG: hypothetical protein DMF91_03265 [Acidobacteriota bacterium]